MYPGAELPVIDAIKLGSPGCISATANINSKNIGEVIELCHQDNWQKATDLHKNVKEVRYLFQDYSAIPAQKAMLAKKYSNNSWKNIRPPLERISDSAANELANKLIKFSFNF